MLLYQRNELKLLAYNAIFQEGEIRPVILNSKLQVIDLPLATLNFLRKMFDDPLLERLPSPMTGTLTIHAAPDGQLNLNSGPWRFRVKTKRGDVICHACVLPNERKQPLLILKLEEHGRRRDFSALASRGLTPREIEALSYLPLGYTNRQIAMAMEITADEVKKAPEQHCEQTECPEQCGNPVSGYDL